jgi:hypothetical protein
MQPLDYVHVSHPKRSDAVVQPLVLLAVVVCVSVCVGGEGGALGLGGGLARGTTDRNGVVCKPNPTHPNIFFERVGACAHVRG